ncbi:MAG: helix-turn-helix transcriptional regulator [Lachnospiraceae bacterium]|nr:helix-turn-helix transcriptional regulator [Lachnospiraceae bacterium]
MTLGQRLIELREEKGIFQKELAAIMNVSVSTISNYENDVHDPDLEILRKLADFFQVSTDYLLLRTDCRYDLSSLNQRISKDYTVSEFINTTLELPQKDISTVVEYVDLLTMRKQLQNTNLSGE